MNNARPDAQVTRSPDAATCNLSVLDIVGYLIDLAKLNEEEKTGNPELSRGLRHLAKALRRYRDYPLSELTDVLGGKSSQSNRPKRAPVKTKLTLPSDLEDIQISEAERILKNEGYTKQQVVELGFSRFGISRSLLTRLSKEDAVISVQAALEHEKSLDVIAREARRSGVVRVS